jgi:hypothetical protein
MIRDVVLNVMLPAVIACAVMTLAWRPWRRGERAVVRGAWASPVAFGIGYLISFLVVSGGVDTSLERWQWLGVLALIAAMAGVAIEQFRRPAWLAWVLVTLVGAAGVWMIDLPRVDAWSWRITLGVAIIATYAALSTVAQRPGRLGPLIVLIMVFSVASVIVFQANFLKLALTAGSLGAMSGVLLLAVLANRNAMLGRGGATFIAAVLPTMLLVGYAYDYADIQAWVFVLPLIGLSAMALTAAPLIARRPAWQQAAVQVIAAVIPCAIALAAVFGDTGGADDAGVEDIYGEYTPY